jgi:hypothetical protein
VAAPSHRLERMRGDLRTRKSRSIVFFGINLYEGWDDGRDL